MGGVLGRRRRCGWEVGVYDNVCGLRERDGYGRKGFMNNKCIQDRSLARFAHSLTMYGHSTRLTTPSLPRILTRALPTNLIGAQLTSRARGRTRSAPAAWRRWRRQGRGDIQRRRWR